MQPLHLSIAALGVAPWCERSRKPHASFPASPRHRCWLPSSAHQENPNATSSRHSLRRPARYVNGVARTVTPLLILHQVILSLHGLVGQMATSLTVSSKFTITSYGSEVFGDCGNVKQGWHAKRNVSLSNSLLGSGMPRHRHVQNRIEKKGPSPCQALFGWNAPNDEDDAEDDSSDDDSNNNLSSETFREQMERMVNVNNSDDVSFRGIDLATIIRKKYGRSYDVQFIKKEFMGRQLLAMNVMWKYREQRSFPLTEEEYLLHLDDIANNLRCWGAVGLVRNSLEKTKERPRIGKAVSIFINLDESGGRAREWISR